MLNNNRQQLEPLQNRLQLTVKWLVGRCIAFPKMSVRLAPTTELVTLRAACKRQRLLLHETQ
jgi:hypothetical protein